MLRTALTPRFLGLLGLVLVLCTVFVWLGRWQLGVAESSAHREAVERARSQPPADITTVIEPHRPFRGDLSSRPVTATGHYAPDGQLLVPGRVLEGRPGFWVLTPFVVDRNGATLPAVRGFVPDAGDVPPPPEGTVTISGGLAPGESPSPTPVPSGQIGSVDLSLLVNTWPGDLYNAFVFVEDEQPAVAGSPTRVPTPVADSGLQWRNAAYAVQWWIFALFALWMWGRMVRDETRRARAEAEAGEVTASGVGEVTASGVGEVTASAVGEATASGPAPDDRHRVAAGENGARDDA